MKWRSEANLSAILDRLDAKTGKTIWQKSMRQFVFAKMVERGIVTAKGKFRVRTIGHRWEYQKAQGDAKARRALNISREKIAELKQKFSA